MKVTALIPDPLINEVTRRAKGKNLTDCLVIALKEWLAAKKIAELNQKVRSKPLEFTKGYSATKIRTANRNR